ncbi:MAG: hypothetical protein PUP92_14065 [Rhizonema sp. PD38]|nr:hypothetical protein [Rhizonema sp. PD38]
MIRKILLLASLPLVALPFISLSVTPAAAKPIRENVCPQGNPSEFVHAETNRVDVYICGGDLPHIYVSKAKDGSSEITIPLLQTSKRKTFVALNENSRNIYRYTLTPERLTVTKNGKVIVSERARWLH